MDKNKEEEVKATQKMAGGDLGFGIGAGVFFTALLAALIIPTAIKSSGAVTAPLWHTALWQVPLLFASCLVALTAVAYLFNTLEDKGIMRTPAAIIKDIKSVFRRTPSESKQKGEKAEIIDVNPNSIQFTDKKQDKPKNPLSEAKANELKKAYTNDAAKNQDNKQPSNEAKQNKRIRTSQA